MFEFDSLCYEHAPGKGIKDISLKLPNAGLVALVGRNGSGKSTLLDCACGVLVPASGDIRFRGRAIDPLAEVAYRKRIGYCPSQPFYIENLTVRENLELVAALRTGKSRAWRDALPWLERFDGERHLGVAAGELSAGQLRACAIVSALIGNPDALVFDEPGNDLDIGALFVLRELLAECSADRLVIASTHILDAVRDLPVRGIFLEEGQVAHDGEFSAGAQLEAAYRELVWNRRPARG